jgi:hypothetical protein
VTKNSASKRKGCEVYSVSPCIISPQFWKDKLKKNLDIICTKFRNVIKINTDILAVASGNTPKHKTQANSDKDGMCDRFRTGQGQWENWTLRTVDQKYLEIFQMWCWRRIEKISWTDSVKNEVLHRVKDERNILRTIKRRKANWIGQILRRNCLPKYVIERKI